MAGADIQRMPLQTLKSSVLSGVFWFDCFYLNKLYFPDGSVFVRIAIGCKKTEVHDNTVLMYSRIGPIS